MKKLILFALFSAVIITAAAEQPLQTGAQWYYSARGMTGDEGYFRFEYVKDTLIAEKNCIQIEILDVNERNNVQRRDTVYLLFENRKIYHYLHSDFHLLYDFNVEAGDTIHTTYYHAPWGSYTPYLVDINLLVTATQDTLINNKVLKRYTFTLLHPENENEWIHIYFDGTAIENIGNTDGYIFPKDNVHIDDSWQPFGFRCFVTDEFTLKSLFWRPACDYTYSPYAVSNPKTNDLNIRISDNQLFIENIESHNAFIQIFDTNGRTVFAGKLNSNNSINIATLHKGLYLLRLHTENLEIQTVKFGKL